MADSQDRATQRGKTLAGMRVLVVEDDTSVRTTVGQLLASVGCEVTMAADGAEAIARAQEVLPDVIILDLSLPSVDLWGSQFDGFGVMKWLERRLAKAIPVIVLTGRQDEATRREAEAMGVRAFMGKPFSARELVAAVRGVIE